MMNQNRKLTGKDVIAIGIYSAIYFVLNFMAMVTGLIPLLWIYFPERWQYLPVFLFYLWQ